MCLQKGRWCDGVPGSNSFPGKSNPILKMGTRHETTWPSAGWEIEGEI